MEGRLWGRGFIVLAACAWLFGVAWQLRQPVVGAHAPAWAGGALAALALCMLIRRALRRAAARAGLDPPARGRLWRLPGRLTLLVAAVAVAVFSFAQTEWRAAERLAQGLAPDLEGRDLVVVGTVAELPRLSAIGTRFVFEVESAALAPTGFPASAALGGAAPAQVQPPVQVRVPERLSLGWFHGYDGDSLLAQPPTPIVVGDRWRLPVRLKRPHGAMNPHGFDLELWLFEQDLRATGTVRPGAQRLGPGAAHPVEALRQRIRDAILLRVADPSAAGVIAALAVGDQAAIDGESWELFRITGVAHLMSISGLHVTMFAWLAAALLGRLWRQSPRLMLAVPTPSAARWGGLLLATAYALLSGFGVPAQRTLLMLAVVVVLRSTGLRWPSLLVLLASGVAVTLADPWALLQPGFWLSFAAVGLLMLSEPVAGHRPARDSPAGEAAPGRPPTALGPAERWRRLTREALRTQVIATVGLAPLTLVFFQQVSVAGFAANLVAIPLVTLLVTPLSLLGVLVPPLWDAAAFALQGLSAALGWLAGWPGAVWHAAAAPPWALAAGLLGGALLVMPLPGRLRACGLVLALPLLAPPVARPAPGAFEVVVADVGQGTSVIVRTHGRLLVYDAGPQYTPDADAGGRVLVPLLRARGETGVDLLVLSHRDTDHVGGAASLIKALRVRAMTSSLEPFHPLRARLPAHTRCDAGQRWAWDGVEFEMLHPTPPDHERPPRPNAVSCVLRVTGADGRRLLLTGDIEAAQEAALVQREGAALRSEVLLVPHHGSRTSSTPGFIDTVAPQAALVQAAYRSRFGHPAPDVVARYEARGIRLLRTDRCGAWTWPADQCQREAGRRYWHHPGP